MLTEFGRDFVAALSTRPRSISPKYFYDVEGSRLFDRICELPEYYPTRTELAILAANAGEIAAQMGPGAEIVEFGAGSLRKVRLLLDAMEKPACYRPIDISGEHMARSAAELQRVRYKAGDDRIITLGELCDLVAGRTTLVLELKRDSPG